MGKEEKQQIAAFGFSIIGELVSGKLHPEERVRLIREKSRRIRQIPILIQNPCQQQLYSFWARSLSFLRSFRSHQKAVFPQNCPANAGMKTYIGMVNVFKEVCGMKKRFSAEELRELRNLIPINTVIKELLSVPSKISEGHFRFLCPLCNEFQTSTNSSTNLARCYHCEKNFNPIDMVMAVKASQFIDSATYLQEVLSRSRQVKKMMADIDARA
jgi:hypothetical protein